MIIPFISTCYLKIRQGEWPTAILSNYDVVQNHNLHASRKVLVYLIRKSTVLQKDYCGLVYIALESKMEHSAVFSAPTAVVTDRNAWDVCMPGSNLVRVPVSGVRTTKKQLVGA
jgi:hypothetical protein